MALQIFIPWVISQTKKNLKPPIRRPTPSIPTTLTCCSSTSAFSQERHHCHQFLYRWLAHTLWRVLSNHMSPLRLRTSNTITGYSQSQLHIHNAYVITLTHQPNTFSHWPNRLSVAAYEVVSVNTVKKVYFVFIFHFPLLSLAIAGGIFRQNFAFWGEISGCFEYIFWGKEKRKRKNVSGGLVLWNFSIPGSLQ